MPKKTATPAAAKPTASGVVARRRVDYQVLALEEPPKKIQARESKLTLVLRELATKPGRWAKVSDATTPAIGNARAGALRAAARRIGLRVDVTARAGVVFARVLP